MRALVKYSILPVLAIPVGVYLYNLSTTRFFTPLNPARIRKSASETGIGLRSFSRNRHWRRPSVSEASLDARNCGLNYRLFWTV